MEPSVDRKKVRSFLRVLPGSPPSPGLFPRAICGNIIRLGTSHPLLCRTFAPAKKQEPPFPHGRLDALAFRLPEREGPHGVREVVVGVVRTSERIQTEATIDDINCLKTSCERATG